MEEEGGGGWSLKNVGVIFAKVGIVKILWWDLDSFVFVGY